MKSLHEYEVFYNESTGKGTFVARFLGTVRGIHFLPDQELVIEGEYYTIKHVIRAMQQKKLNGKNLYLPDLGVLLVRKATHNQKKYLDKVIGEMAEDFPRLNKIRRTNGPE